MLLKFATSAALLTGALMTSTMLLPTLAQADDRTSVGTTGTGTIVLAQNSEKKKKKASSSQSRGRAPGETPPPNDRGS